MYQTGELTATGVSGFAAIGTSVAINGSTVVAGAPVGTNEVGAAYVFEEPSSGWTNMNQTATLSASDGTLALEFGYSVAVNGDMLVVGAYLGTANHRQQGAAYLYHKPANGWINTTQDAKFGSSDGANGENFGYAAAIAGGGDIVVGADQYDESPAGPGKVYIFGP